MASLVIKVVTGSVLKTEGMEIEPPWFAPTRVIYYEYYIYVSTDYNMIIARRA